MYSHLLVPVDGTDLSIETVGRAVEFARAMGARITFFHAAAGSRRVAVRRRRGRTASSAPADFAYAFEGRARELLAKAESAARGRTACRASRGARSTTPPTSRSSTGRGARRRLRPDLHGVAWAAEPRRHDARLANPEVSRARRHPGPRFGDR